MEIIFVVYNTSYWSLFLLKKFSACPLALLRFAFAGSVNLTAVMLSILQLIDL
jgi:hypothetical protein